MEKFHVLAMQWAVIALCLSGQHCASTPRLKVSADAQERVTEKNLIPAVLDVVGYNDIYTIAGEMDNGYALSVVFSIFTFPMISKVSGIAVILTDPQGRMTKAVTYRLPGAWAVSESPFRIEWKDLGWFGGDLQHQRLVVNDKHLKIDVTFKNLEAAWRPRGGRIQLESGSDHFVDVTLIAPKSEFAGKALVRGQPLRIHGFGVLERDFFTTPVYGFAHTWRRMRFFGPDLTLITSSFDGTARTGRQEWGWMYARQDEVVLSPAAVQTRIFQSVDALSHGPRPYRKAVDFSAVAGDFLVNYRMSGTRYQLDLLTLFHQILRAIVQLVAHPNIYSDRFDVQVAYQGQVVATGPGVAEQIIFNPAD